jgi:hypothetical protein
VAKVFSRLILAQQLEKFMEDIARIVPIVHDNDSPDFRHGFVSHYISVFAICLKERVFPRR